MDDEHAVLEQLDRIDRLQRGGAPAADLLDEVRGLLHAAERLRASRPDARLGAALDRCNEALGNGASGTPAHDGAAAVRSDDPTVAGEVLGAVT